MSTPRDRNGFDDDDDTGRAWHEPAHLDGDDDLLNSRLRQWRVERLIDQAYSTDFGFYQELE